MEGSGTWWEYMWEHKGVEQSLFVVLNNLLNEKDPPWSFREDSWVNLAWGHAYNGMVLRLRIPTLEKYYWVGKDTSKTFVE